MILCDTDVLIEYFKGAAGTVTALRRIGPENIALSSVPAMELYFGAIDKVELLKIKKAIGALNILEINPQISGMATNLVETFSKSHGLRIPDALIAATALTNALELFTFNPEGLSIHSRNQVIFSRIGLQNLLM